MIDGRVVSQFDLSGLKPTIFSLNNPGLKAGVIHCTLTWTLVLKVRHYRRPVIQTASEIQTDYHGKSRARDSFHIRGQVRRTLILFFLDEERLTISNAEDAREFERIYEYLRTNLIDQRI